MQNQFVDLYRSGIKTATEVARMSLENSVRLQEKQLGIVRNILDENRRSADSLGEARSLEELMAMQSRIAGAQLERVAEFWSSVWHAAAESQKAWIEQLQSQSAHTSEDVARVATNQVSRAAGSVREAASAAQPQHRKSA
jgi:hypothetical protein